MKILVLVLVSWLTVLGCDTPSESTGGKSDSTVLDPNKTKVQTDTTMFKDSTIKRDSLR